MKIGYRATLLLFLFLFNCNKPVNKSKDYTVMALLNTGQTEISLEMLTNLENAGFNTIAMPYSGEEQNINWLHLADSLNLKLILSDQRIDLFMQNPQKNSLLDNMINDYCGHPSFLGYYSFDKPDSSMYSMLSHSVHYLNNNDPEHPALVYMLPMHTEEMDRENRFYLDLWHLIDSVSPRLICFEQFPVFRTDSDYYQNLETLNSICQRQNITWWTTLTQTHHFSSAIEKSFLDVQFYSMLAYGAKGLVYYTNSFDKEKEEPIIQGMEKNSDPFQNIRKLNRQVKALSPILNQLEPVGVYHTHPVPKGCRALQPGLPLVNVKGDNFLIGVYKRDTVYYAWIVNKNTSSGSGLKIYFNENHYQCNQITENGLTSIQISKDPKQQNYCEMIFKAGEGRLFEIITRE